MPDLITSLLTLPTRLFRIPVDWGVRILTQPRELYMPSEVTNLRALKKRLKVGDVLLVCGNARISHIVKLLTLSQWSHVVLYVGDRRDLLTEKEKTEWSARYGYEALKTLVIDADPLHGVHLRPLEEWCGLMVRHCRADALKQEDVNKVVEHALGQLGHEYDNEHILRLLFFFAFPWDILPESLRRMFTDFTLSETDRICSRVLAESFHSVGYPIRPTLVERSRGALHDTALGVAFGLKYRARSALRLLYGGRMDKAFQRLSDNRYVEIHLRGTRHLTPADYDLSRFFTVIKDKGDLTLDYRSARVLCGWHGESW